MSIIGERMDAVRHMLGEVSERITVNEIARRIQANDEYCWLLDVSSHSETLGGILRCMEAEGIVDRTRHGGTCYYEWGLVRDGS